MQIRKVNIGCRKEPQWRRLHYSSTAFRILACHSPSLRCASSSIWILIGCAVSFVLIGRLWVWLRNSGFLFHCGWVDVRLLGGEGGGMIEEHLVVFLGFFFSFFLFRKKKSSVSHGMLCATDGKLVCSFDSTNPATTTNHWRPSLIAAVEPQYPVGRRPAINDRWLSWKNVHRGSGASTAVLLISSVKGCSRLTVQKINKFKKHFYCQLSSFRKYARVWFQLHSPSAPDILCAIFAIMTNNLNINHKYCSDEDPGASKSTKLCGVHRKSFGLCL